MIEGVPPSDRGAHDSHLVVRRKLCAKRPWCTEDAGHVGPCIEVAREKRPPTDFGPRRKR